MGARAGKCVAFSLDFWVFSLGQADVNTVGFIPLITHIPTHLELLTRFALNSDASNVLNVEPVILSLCWTTAEWLNKAEKVLGQNGFWESFMGCTRLHYFRQLE